MIHKLIFIHSLFHRLIDKLSHSLMLKSSIQLLDPLSIPDLKLALYKQGTRGHNIVMDGWVGTCTSRLNKKSRTFKKQIAILNFKIIH